MALILAADDDPVIIEMVKSALEPCTHQVVSVANGVDLVEKAKDWRPHLIVSDLMMPGIYGSTASKTLQDDPLTASIPVIFLTGVQADRAAQIIPRGPRYRLLSKPVDIALLRRTVEELLEFSAGQPS